MTPEPKIRVLIADDSAFMRKVLRMLLSSDSQLEIVGEARDGVEAIAQNEALNPDVITMDINMPRKDGLQATEEIMASKPRPILMVSSEAREGAEPTLRALQLGAIDFVLKPVSGVDLDMESVRDELLRKVKIASKVRVVRNASRLHMAAAMPAAAAPGAPGNGDRLAFSSPKPAARANSEADRAPQSAGERFPLVVLAASTGGPATLMQFLPRFPANYPAAVLLIQHMPAGFTTQFSRQLAEVCAIRVKEAETGEAMRAGTVYLCPGGQHLRVSASGRLMLDEGPRVNGYRPSADLAMESVAKHAGSMALGVVMTGMGNDGAKGAQAIKAAGGWVIAQDEATSVIFGMPSEAIKAGAVDQVLPLDAIPAAIERRVLYVFGAARVGAL